MDPNIGIVVNKDLYPSIRSSIDRYAQDLSEIEGKMVWIDGQAFGKNPLISELHDSLSAHYYGVNLEGAVFIGDLPVAHYEMKRQYGVF